MRLELGDLTLGLGDLLVDITDIPLDFFLLLPEAVERLLELLELGLEFQNVAFLLLDGFVRLLYEREVAIVQAFLLQVLLLNLFKLRLVQLGGVENILLRFLELI